MFGCIVDFFLYWFHSRVAEFAGMEYLRSMIMGKVRIHVIASIIEINRSTIPGGGKVRNLE